MDKQLLHINKARNALPSEIVLYYMFLCTFPNVVFCMNGHMKSLFAKQMPLKKKKKIADSHALFSTYLNSKRFDVLSKKPVLSTSKAS